MLHWGWFSIKISYTFLCLWQTGYKSLLGVDVTVVVTNGAMNFSLVQAVSSIECPSWRSFKMINIKSLSNRLVQTSRELRVWWCCVLGWHSKKIYKAFNDWKHCANFSHLVSYTHFSILAVARNSFSKILMFKGKNPSHFYPKAHQKDFRTETRQWIVCPGFRVVWIECIERSTLELSVIVLYLPKVAGLEQQFKDCEDGIDHYHNLVSLK